MKFGEILQACRERAGYNQETLADLINRQQSDISRIERNRKKLDVDTLIEWGKATDSNEVIIAYIYGKDGLRILSKIIEPMGLPNGGVICREIN